MFRSCKGHERKVNVHKAIVITSLQKHGVAERAVKSVLLTFQKNNMY